MRRFVAIVGSRNAGKSTVVKCLSGCPNNSFRGFIEDRRTGQSIYVSCNSPQENSIGLSTVAELRAVLQSVIDRDKCRGIIMALQPSFPYARLTMETVLAEADHLRFKIHVYVIDPERSGASGPFSLVAQRLSHLGFNPQSLDGRRFGHISAALVNDATQLVA